MHAGMCTRFHMATNGGLMECSWGTCKRLERREVTDLSSSRYIVMRVTNLALRLILDQRVRPADTLELFLIAANAIGVQPAREGAVGLSDVIVRSIGLHSQ